MEPDVIVIGSGVIGLTSAVLLAEGGRQVAVWTREPAAETTSAVAGGLWWPYRIQPEDRVAQWSRRTYDVYAEMAADPQGTGVRMLAGTKPGDALADLGPWSQGLPGLRSARPEELPDGVETGVYAVVPIVDMPAHLDFLRRRLAVAGGTVERRAVGSLAEAAGAAPCVVNCSGLGARELADDDSVQPVQGQLVIVENPGIEEWTVSAYSGATATEYAIPQPYGLVLGGTAREGAWSTVPDEGTAADILARCTRLLPELTGVRVLEHRVGLRPARPAVRLEAEQLPGGGLCVHNYGHGGAGITVAWGCAEEAAGLVAAARP